MKKLMMTTVAALGFAALAQADVLNSTGFEDYGSNPFRVDKDDTGSSDGTRHQYWTGTGDFSQTELKTYGEDVVKPTNLPDDFETAGDYFLSVDTGNDVMYRKAGSDAGSVDLTQLTQGALFFDANVKFTASEQNVEVKNGDKLLVWLKGDENSQTTNLVVTAGLYNESTEKYDQTNFTVVGDYAADTWYRLTVKAAVDNNKLTYFNVYIDGEPVVATDKTTDFYSLVQTGVNKYVIAEAGFQGTGALDNVVWTTTDPFPVVEPTTVALKVTLTDENFAFTELAANAEVVNVAAPAPIVADVGDVITFVAKVADGFTPTVAGYVLQKSAEKDENECYAYTFTATVTQAMIDDRLTLTINVTADGGEEPTPEDTTEINADGKGYVADETGSTYTKAAVEAMVTVVAPNADSLSEEAKTAYDGYFTKNATYNTETKKWEVAVTLDTVTLEADVDDAVEAALEAVVGDAETKAVEIPAGFYYKIEHGATVGLTGEPLTGTSTGSVAMPALGEDAGFFKVSVGTTTFAE